MIRLADGREFKSGEFRVSYLSPEGQRELRQAMCQLIRLVGEICDARRNGSATGSGDGPGAVPAPGTGKVPAMKGK